MDPVRTAAAREDVASVSDLLIGFGEWLDRRRGPARRTVPGGAAPAHAGVGESSGRWDRQGVHGRVLPGSQHELGEVDGEVGALVPAVRACDGSNIGRVVGCGSGVRRLAFGVAAEVGAGSRP